MEPDHETGDRSVDREANPVEFVGIKAHYVVTGPAASSTTHSRTVWAAPYAAGVDVLFDA